MRYLIAAAALGLALDSAAQAGGDLADCNAVDHRRTLSAVPVQATLDARAAWLNERWIRWPRPDGNGRFRLYHSAAAQIVHRIGQTVTGADGALELSVFGGAVSLAEPARFSHVGSGIVLQVGEADRARLDALVRGQLVLVHEDSAGRVRDATTAQVAGLLDALYAGAQSPHRWARWPAAGAPVSTCGHRPPDRCSPAFTRATQHPPTACCRCNATPRPASGAARSTRTCAAATSPTWSTSTCPTPASSGTASPTPTR
jgi:hypothetical protein